LPGN
jgi:hypothetical protein